MMRTRVLRNDRPATYRVFVQGVLDKGWSDFLQGMAVSTVHVEHDQYITELQGRVPDQAGLFGVLNFLYDLGFPILGLECLDPPLALAGACDLLDRIRVEHANGQPL